MQLRKRSVAENGVPGPREILLRSARRNNSSESLRIVCAGVTLVEAVGNEAARLTPHRKGSDRASRIFQVRAAF